jgi:hypothetical protein
MNKMQITLYDNAGNIVSYDEVEAQTATKEEIDAMVALIDGGMRACDAAALVKG